MQPHIQALGEAIMLGDFSVDDDFSIDAITGCVNGLTSTWTWTVTSTAQSASVTSNVISLGTDANGVMITEAVFWARLYVILLSVF